MTASFGSTDYTVLQNQNAIQVPYKAEEQTEAAKEEIVVPFRAENSDENTDTFVKSETYAAEASCSYDTAKGVEIEVTPFSYTKEKTNGTNTVTIQAAPTIDVVLNANRKTDSQLNIWEKSTCAYIGVGGKFSAEAEKKLQTAENTSLTAKIDLNAGAGVEVPTSDKTTTPSTDLRTAAGASYGTKLSLGVRVEPDDKNKVDTYLFAQNQGFAGQVTAGDKSDAGKYTQTGKSLYVNETKFTNAVSGGIGIKYSRPALSVGAEFGYGGKSTKDGKMTNGAYVGGTFTWNLVTKKK